MTATDCSAYGVCDGTLTMWVEGASTADSFMFLLDVAPAPVIYDTIIVNDTIITLTGICAGDYTVTLDTLWGSCPNYGGGCCNCVGSTSCFGSPGGGATATVGGPAPDLDFIEDIFCPDQCNNYTGSHSVIITGQAPPFLVDFGYGWTSNTSIPSIDCSYLAPIVISVMDSTGQIVSHPSSYACDGCGFNAILGSIPTIEVCSGQTIGPIDFNSYLQPGPINVSSGMFSWTNSNVNTGISAQSPTLIESNPNNYFSFTAANVTVIETSTITLVSEPFYFTGPISPICFGNTITFNVIVNPGPTIDAGIDQTVCAGDQITLTATTSETPNWDNGVTDGVPFAQSVPSGTYTVTATDAGGCQNSDQVNVTVNPLPPIDAGTDQSICDGDFVTLSGSGGTTYAWNNGVSDNSAFSPLVGTITYEVTGTDANGCENTDQVDITVNSLPTIDAGLGQTVCDGDQITLSGSGGSSYTWNNGVSNNAAFAATAGTTVYQVTGTDFNGCQNSDQVSVLAHALPTIDGGLDQSICTGDSITLVGSGAISYVWNNGISDNIPFTTFPGVVTYQVTGTDVNGCENVDQVFITTHSLPIIDAGVDQSLCDGDSVTLSGSGGTIYTWDNGVSDSIAFTPTLGTTTYALIGIDANGCMNVDSMDVLVNSLPLIDAGMDQEVCDGVQVILIGSSGTANTFTWDNGITNGVAFVPTLGISAFEVTGVDSNGCQNTDILDVTVYPIPTIYAGPDTLICFGDSLLLSATGDGVFEWTGGLPDSTYIYPISSQMQLICSATTTFGCQNSDTMIVYLNSPINTNLILNGALITATFGFSNYEWIECESGLTLQNGPQNTFLATQDGLYKVIITDGSGCPNTSNCVTIDYLSLEESELHGIDLSPNPSSGIINVSNGDQISSGRILDAMGRIVSEFRGETDQLDVSNFENGHYFVEIKTKAGRLIRSRVIKE